MGGGTRTPNACAPLARQEGCRPTTSGGRRSHADQVCSRDSSVGDASGAAARTAAAPHSASAVVVGRRRLRQGAEETVLLVVRPCSEEQRVRTSRVSAVAEAKPPETVDPQRCAGLRLQAAAPVAGDGIENVTRSVTEV